MKYKGEKLIGPNKDFIVLPKNDKDIVIWAQAVIDPDSDLERIIKRPEPPTIVKPGGAQEYDLQDKDYREAINKYAHQKTNYLILKSLEINPDIEWETVKLNDPNTWDKWSDELKEAGFSKHEVARISTLVIRVNGLSDSSIEEARQRFLIQTQKSEK